MLPVLKTVQTTYKTFTLVKTALIALQKQENTETALNTILESKNTAGKTARWIISKILGKELTKETVAEMANTAATGANTTAQNANNIMKAIGKALTGDFSGLLLVAAGAIAVGTVALIANTNAQKKENEEKEKANQLSNDLATSNDELTETYKNLKDSFDSYDVALDKLNNCIKGTQE